MTTVQLIKDCKHAIETPSAGGKISLVIPGNLPESYPQSTLPSSYSVDDLVQVYECKGLERSWLVDLLDDQRIPYKIEVVPCWDGVKYAKYSENQAVYVEEIYEKIVKDYIDEYNNEENYVFEDIAEGTDDILPQIKCPSCETEIDFDYPKCPFCGHSIF